MTDPLRRLQSGERLTSIPAAAWNAFVDAARFVRGLQVGDGLADTSLAVGPGQVLVLNNSGEDRDQFDVLQLSEAVVTPTDSPQEFARRIALTGITPDADWVGSFVVLAEPIASGQIGRAWIDGACPARVNGGGGFADTKDGEAGYLQAGDVGSARIIWSESGEDERLAYVRLNDPRSFVLVKTVAGPDATPYPAELDNPTTYRCQILTAPSYVKTAGAGLLTYTETSRYDHVMNLVSGHYIEEGSILGAFPLDGHLYTMDKLVQQEMLVLSHSLMTTAAGSGSLSRLNPRTGEVFWTVDAGTEVVGGTDYPRLFVSCAIDSRGNVYAFWLRSATVDGQSNGAVDALLPQGVMKFDKNGNLLGSVSLPVMNLSVSSISDISQHPTIRLAESDDSKVFCGTAYDTDGKWLYCLDESLATTWAIGESEAAAINPPSGPTGSTCGLCFGSSGSIYAANGAYIFELDDTGSLSAVAESRASRIFSVPGTGSLRSASRQTPLVLDNFASFPGSHITRNYAEFPTPQAGGTWGSEFTQKSLCGWSDGLVDVYLTGNHLPWTTSGGASKSARAIATAIDGTPLWSSEALSIIGFSVSRDTASGDVFVSGTHTGLDPVTGTAATGPIAKVSADETAFTNEWVKNIKASGSGGIGFDVCARTIQA